MHHVLTPHLRPAALQEPQADGSFWIKEPGLTLWHDTVRHLFRSEASAGTIPLYASLQQPGGPGAEQEEEAWVRLS